MAGGPLLESGLLPVNVAAEARPEPGRWLSSEGPEATGTLTLFQSSQGHRPREKQVETGLSPPFQSHVAGRGVPASCLRLRPDLTHTFIQQVFIKRLSVQGTLGEGAAIQALLAPLPWQCSLLERQLQCPRAHQDPGAILAMPAPQPSC